MLDDRILFAEIILPLAVGHTFTYRVPEEMKEEMIPGKRVLVPFGKNKVYSGLIFRIHNEAPKLYEARYLHSSMDSEPIIFPWNMEFWSWISEYYQCHLGEVMKAALPSGLKLENENFLVINDSEDFGEDFWEDLGEKERLVWEIIQNQGEVRLDQLPRLTGIKSVLNQVKSLISKKRIQVREEISRGYQIKKQVFIRLNPEYAERDKKKGLFEEFKKKPSQLSLIMAYYALGGHQEKEISKNQLLEASHQSSNTLNLLVKKEIFEIYYKRVSRLEPISNHDLENFTLSPAQEDAYLNIKSSFEKYPVVLLHGITSSGKTEIYFRLIEEFLKKGEQVLYLLPEIALTSQLVNRLRKQFGDQVGVYHSLFNENERVETWEGVLNGRFKVLIGARSALFLPFLNLGFIIVDEEHDSSFKQIDPAPRYNARDSAIYLGTQKKIPILLGSATPSIESYYNSQNGKYGLVKLLERFGGVPMPIIEILDLREEKKQKKLKFQFSSRLLKALENTMKENNQAILFQNRRGYSPFILCKSCGFIPKCIHCDVSLTLHKSTHKLHCHYCGYKTEIPLICPVCQDPNFQDQGLGTEKIEEELQILYPQIRIGRMDQDTTRGKNGHRRIVSDLEENRVDVLVGTQMVSKGLDFGKVQLIGIMNADQILNFPDFRAFEKGYQILTQVAGRAGRRSIQGQVIIQTYSPLHPVLNFIQNNDYFGLYQAEILERENFHYPPFTRLIRVICKNKDSILLNKTCLELSHEFRNHFGDLVLGPVPALISRIRNLYIQEFLFKLSRRTISPPLVKKVMKEIILNLLAKKEFRSTQIQIDVDPS